MSTETAQPKAAKKTNKLLAAIIVLLILALAGGGFFAWNMMHKSPYDEKMEANAVVGTMPGKSEEQILEELNRKVNEKTIAFSINASPVYKDGKSKGNILFENPKNNDKLTRMELIRDETEELIYKTGLMEPGSYVPEAELLVDLPAGTYVCTAYIYAYRQSDESFLGKVAAGITVTVQN